MAIDRAKQPGINIKQIFLDQASFEHRPDYLQLPQQTEVSVEVSLSLTSAVATDDSAAIVRIEASSKPEDDPIYRFRIVMTALIESEAENANFPLNNYAQQNAWALLVPFLREAVASITSRGRFGALWLKPINVLALIKGDRELADQESAQVQP